MARTDSQIYRLLNLIPYIVQHPGVTVDEICGVFRIGRHDLVQELELINMCGKPEYTPGDLIEVSIEGENIFILMADYFSRPFRFTASELISLYLAGRALSDLAGLKEAATFQSALAKLERALLSGEKADLEAVDDNIVMQPDHPDQPKLQLLREAMDDRRQIDMEYYSSGRDVITRRRLNPLNLFFGSGNWYLLGWDHLRREPALPGGPHPRDQAPAVEVQARGLPGAGGRAGDPDGAGQVQGQGGAFALRPLLRQLGHGAGDVLREGQGRGRVGALHPLCRELRLAGEGTASLRYGRGDSGAC
jgi:proteasome accessory factor C